MEYTKKIVTRCQNTLSSSILFYFYFIFILFYFKLDWIGESGIMEKVELYTRQDLWDLFFDIGSSVNQQKAVDKLCSTLNVKPCTELNGVVKKELKRFKEKLQPKKNQRPTAPTNPTLFNEIQLEATANNEEEPEEPMDTDPLSSPSNPNLKKPFHKLTNRSKRTRTDEINNLLKEFVANENDQFPDTNLTITNVLGYLLYKNNYVHDKEMATIGTKIYTNTLEPKHFTRTEAVTVMLDLDLSKVQCKVFKSYLKSKGVSFPGTTVLLEERKLLKPEIQPLERFEQNPHPTLPGVAVPYDKLVKMTTGSIIDLVTEQDPNLLDQYTNLKAVYKDGADGSGSQAVMKSSAMFNMAENIYQHAIAPLRMEGTNRITGDIDVIWRNSAPNSPFSCRPYMLIRRPEGQCEKYDFEYTESCIKRLEEEPSAIVSMRNPGAAKQVEHKIMDSMKDLKLKKSLSGCGGAPCILCNYREKDWKDEEQIMNGFAITRTAELIQSVYEAMVKDNSAASSISSKDRLGVTQQPITTSDQWSLCITHSYINCTNWFIKVLGRINAKYFYWIEKSTYIGEPIRRGTNIVTTAFELNTGLRLSMVNRSLGKTGGSTDGNSGRRFFSKKSVETILQVIEPQYQDTIITLHKNLSVIFRIMSCTQKVDVEAYRQLTVETSLLIARKLNWVEINFTLHGALHHSADLIAINDGYGLGDLSEEALEANNKYIRKFAEFRARKTSSEDQLTDVLGRLIERSDPFIVHKKMQFRSKRTPCDECGSTAHSTKKHEKATEVNSYDDPLVIRIIGKQLDDLYDKL